MELKNFFAQDTNGNVIPDAYVYVYAPGTQQLAGGLKDANGAALSNPFRGTATGQIQLAAPDGTYDLRVVGALRDYTVKGIQFLDLTEAKNTVVASAGQAANSATAAQDAKKGAEQARDAALLGQSAGVVGKDTLAHLNADLAYGEGTIAYVTNDGANNGVYRKTGASGSGTWVLSDLDRMTAVEAAAASLKVNNLYPFQPNSNWSKIAALRAFILDIDFSTMPGYNPALYYSFAEINKSATQIVLSIYSATSPTGGFTSVFAITSPAGFDVNSKDVQVLKHSNGASVAIVPAAWPTEYNGSVTWAKAGLDSRVFQKGYASLLRVIDNTARIAEDDRTLAHNWSPFPYLYGDAKNAWLRKAIPEIFLSGTRTLTSTYHLATVVKDNAKIHFEIYERTDAGWNFAHNVAIDYTTGINDDKFVVLSGSSSLGLNASLLVNPSLIPVVNASGESRFPLSNECWKEENSWIIKTKSLLGKNFVTSDTATGIINDGYVSGVAFLHPNDNTEFPGDSRFLQRHYGQRYKFPAAASVQRIQTGFRTQTPNLFSGKIRVVKKAAGTSTTNSAAVAPDSGTLIQEFVVPVGGLSDYHAITLDKPHYFKAGEFIYVYLIADAGAEMKAHLAYWASGPYNDQPNPNNRDRFVWSGNADGSIASGWQAAGGTNSDVAAPYAYWATPLRLWSNVVTQDQIEQLRKSIQNQSTETLRATFFDPRFVLPSRLHAVVGTEFNLYYDAITLLPEVGPGEIPMIFDVVCDIGAHDRRSFRVTPTAAQVGDHALVITAYDNKGNVLAVKSTTLTVVAAAGLGTAKQILCIGDSTTDDTGVVTKTLQQKLASFGGVVPTFIGTHGVAPYNMEARTGTTFANYSQGWNRYKFYVTGFPVGPFWPNWTGQAPDGSGLLLLNEERSIDGNGNGWVIGNIWSQPNGFTIGAGWAGQLKTNGVAYAVTNTEVMPKYSIFKDGNGTGALNFAYYLAKFGFSGCDLLSIDLGINDSRGALQSEAASLQRITDAKALISAYLAYNANGKVMICLTKSGASTRDTEAAQHDSYRMNIHRLRELIIEHFDNSKFSPNVFISGSGLMIDRYYGYPLSTNQKVAARYTETITVHADFVHPRAEGYYQVADAMAASVLYILKQP